MQTMSLPITARLLPWPPPPRSSGAIPGRNPAPSRSWRALPLQFVFVVGLLAPPGAAAALIMPGEGEAQLLDLLNHDRQETLKPDALLRAMADWQAHVNARRRRVGERDDQGRDLHDRCLWAGLVGEGVTIEEFYFRTLDAYGGALIFDPMVEEALEKQYEYVGICCVAGEDGMFYWCVTFCRVTRPALLARAGNPGLAGPPVLVSA
jgi:hypothetical protein